MEVIEFFGMPRAGKTTAIEVMESFLKNEGASVRLLCEGARICPLDKKDRFYFNSWSFHNTVNRILEARLDSYDFMLIDRGVIDHAAFAHAIEPNCKEKTDTIVDYYFNFLPLQNEEVYFTVDSEEAIRREKKYKPNVGRVFNTTFLEQLAFSYATMVNYARTVKDRKINSVNGNEHMDDNVQWVLEFSRRLLAQKR